MKNRCGKCKNCLYIEKVKRSVMKTVNPPFSSLAGQIDKVQEVIELWNNELKDHPCIGVETT